MDLELIVEVVRENTGPANQHVLVIGSRGAGKTMLVLRTAAEIRESEELSNLWYPIVFAEESYEVCSPGKKAMRFVHLVNSGWKFFFVLANKQRS
jgi:Ni2+-binding GTPase involved in maturation of urease and hydrogenase